MVYFVFLSSHIIGAAKERERALNPPRGAEITTHTCVFLVLFIFLLFYFFFFITFFFWFSSLSRVSYCVVRAISRLATLLTQLTELSWLDMDVWWDIGNSDMLARRACIP